MSSITLSEDQEMLTLWLAAEKAVAGGQEYRMGKFSLTRADARTITDKINYWTRQVERLQSGGRGGPIVGRIVPVDF